MKSVMPTDFALTEATASVEQVREKAAQDPLRPIYHVTAAARFINDPNGPVWHAGRYHVFFQHLPLWGEARNRNLPVWGHASSPNMVHWRHEPIALVPGPDSYDARGIASGCCVVSEGVPTIIYTGVGVGGEQTQCLATSHDGLCTWQKDPANPAIDTPPPLEGLGDGFRDPYAWHEGDEWRLLAGSSFKGQDGTVLLYRSADLRHWDFMGPLCSGMGTKCIQWECPTFFPIDKTESNPKHALIVSPLYEDIPGLRGLVQYAVGRYEHNRFEPGDWQTVDHGGPTVYYAPNSFEDPQGRRILWGWIMAERPPEAGWCHCLSLPRIVTLGKDDTLRFEPLPELIALRRDEISMQGVDLKPGHELILADARGPHAEVEAIIDLGAATQIELRLGRSADGSSLYSLIYDAPAGKLTFGDKLTDFRLNPGETTLHVRVFLDGIVGEAYVNERLCFSNVLPADPDASGVSLVATGGVAKVEQFAAWKMGSIWEEETGWRMSRTIENADERR